MSYFIFKDDPPSERLLQSGTIMRSKAVSEVMLFTNDGKQHINIIWIEKTNTKKQNSVSPLNPSTSDTLAQPRVLIFNLSSSSLIERQKSGHSGNTVKVNDRLQAAERNTVLLSCGCVSMHACVHTAMMRLCNHTSTRWAPLLIPNLTEAADGVLSELQGPRHSLINLMEMDQMSRG